MFKVIYAILMGISVLSDILSNERVSRTELVFWKIIAAVGILID